MRELATEPKKAYRSLGSENGQAFIGLVADFRAALFVADVPGGPRSAAKDGEKFELDWFISPSCTLKTVIAASKCNDGTWEDAYRIHLEAVTLSGQVLA